MCKEMNIRRKKIKEIEVINMVLKRYPVFDWKINEKITKIQRIPDMYLIINELIKEFINIETTHTVNRQDFRYSYRSKKVDN